MPHPSTSSLETESVMILVHGLFEKMGIRGGKRDYIPQMILPLLFVSAISKLL